MDPSELRPYIDEIFRGRAVLLLGAGSSKEAGAPTSDELATEIVKKFNFSYVYRTLDDLCLWIQEHPPTWNEVLKYIKSRLDVEPTPAHKDLCNYPWKAIFTTNWDTLVENACGDIIQPIRTNNEYRLYEAEGKGIPLFKLHGCVKSFEREVEGLPVFSKADKDREEVRAFRELLFRQLAQHAASFTVIVIGWGFNDEEVLNCFREASSSVRKGYPHLLVDPQPYYPESYYGRFGFKVVKMKFSEFMDSLREFSQNHEFKLEEKHPNEKKSTKNGLPLKFDEALQGFIVSQLAQAIVSRPELYQEMLRPEFIEEMFKRLGVSASKECVNEILESFEVRGTLNPNYLVDVSEKKIFIYFIGSKEGRYLVLRSFLRKIEEECPGEHSTYITFGPCDMIILHYATDEDKTKWVGKIHETFEGFGEYFDLHAVSKIRLFKGYTPLNYEGKILEPEVLNEIVDNYLSADMKIRSELEDKKILLGPAVVEDFRKTGRIYAYIGIKFDGPLPYSQDGLEKYLLEFSKWRRVVRSIFDCVGRYHTILEVICNSIDELNEFTEDLQNVKSGKIMTTTYVIAEVERESFPKVSAKHRGDLEGLKKTISKYIPSEFLRLFDELSIDEKLLLLHVVQKVDRVDLSKLDEKWRRRIQDSVSLFIEGILRNSETQVSSGITSLSVVLEEVGRRALRLLVEKVYGKEYGKAQKELRLPSKNFYGYGLYDLQKAFENINKSDRYTEIRFKVPPEFLRKLDSFRKLRAEVSHRIPGGEHQYFLRLASDTIISGIELIDWLDKNVLSFEMDI